MKRLTECLYAELRPTDVAVTVVFPGGVGTNITGNSGVDIPKVVMKGGRQPKTTAPVDAARRIVDAGANGTFRVLIGSDARTLDRLSRFSPTRAITTVADQMKKDARSLTTVAGCATRSGRTRSWPSGWSDAQGDGCRGR